RDDADDLEFVAVARTACDDALPDGRPAGQEAASERLVDDRDGRRADAIAATEVAPDQPPDAHRREPPWRDGVDIRAPLRRRWAVGFADLIVPARAGDRRDDRQTSGTDAGRRRDRRVEALEQI